MAQKKVKIKLKGDAIKQADEVVLTSGLHSEGQLMLLTPIKISDVSWICSYVVNISDSEGISDVDGQGGDGVRMKLCAKNGAELFAVSLDTFKNLENNSGNEVVVYFEGTRVAQGPCRERFNDGNDKTVSVIYDHDLETVVVKIDDMSVVAYAFHDIPFYRLINDAFYICFSSFTGDAGGVHTVSDIKFAAK